MKRPLISVSAYDLNAVDDLINLNFVNRIHIGGVENNYITIKKSSQFNNTVPHILLNRIDSKERVRDSLLEANVDSILLVNGNPHKMPYMNNMYSTITYFSDFVSVYVGAYPTSYFNSQSKNHLHLQKEILRKKIDSGAKEVYLQFTTNFDKLHSFVDFMRSNNIAVPFHFGLLPNIPFKNIYSSMKEIVSSGELWFHKNNLDFMYSLFLGSEKRSLQLAKSIYETNLCSIYDGFHVTSLDVEISSFLKKLNGWRFDYDK